MKWFWILILFLAPLATAQTQRVYLLPLVVTDLGHGLATREPRHIRDWQDRFRKGDYTRISDAGGANVALVVTNGLTDASHTVITKDVQCFAFPTDLTSKPDSKQVTALTGVLGAYGIPADFITTTVDFETVIKKLLGIFVVAQRYYGEYPGQNLFSNVPVATESRDMSVTEQLKIREVVDSLQVSFRATDIDQRMTLKTVIYSAADAKLDIVPLVTKQ